MRKRRFTIAIECGRIRAEDAEGCVLPGFEEFTFFTHFRDGGFRVSESKSGLAVFDYRDALCATREEAIAKAAGMLAIAPDPKKAIRDRKVKASPVVLKIEEECGL